MASEPTGISHGRIGPLTRLPVFFALQGKRCVVVGSGRAAAWKAELLSAAGACVHAFAPGPAEELHTLAADPSLGRVTVHERCWQPADLPGAAIAVGEFSNDAEAAPFAAAARAAGVPVNVIDRPAFCDFAFGAIVNRSPLVIGVSTDGAAPVFAQAIRTKIETLIPKGFARWADAARRWRPRVAALALPFRSRRSFWERFADRAVACADAVPTEADLAALLASARIIEAGSVIVIGCGQDDPELLTLRAVRALQSADVILFDRSVSADILDFARREAKKMLVGRTDDARSGQPDDAETELIAFAKAGRRVVYLRGDHMAGSNRTDEAIAANCRDAGISVEIVPTGMINQPASSRPELNRQTKSRDPIRARM